MFNKASKGSKEEDEDVTGTGAETGAATGGNADEEVAAAAAVDDEDDEADEFIN